MPCIQLRHRNLDYTHGDAYYTGKIILTSRKPALRPGITKPALPKAHAEKKCGTRPPALKDDHVNDIHLLSIAKNI